MIPNLEMMSDAELMNFWSEYHTQSRTKAAYLFPDRRKGYVKLANTLAAYACNKAVAMQCRNRGDKQAAEIYETHARMTRERLPADVTW